MKNFAIFSQKIITAAAIILVLSFSCFSQETIQQYLSGTDKDHTVQWDFFCTKGMNSGKWGKIAVPGNWEQQSYGGYSYGHDKVKTDETGLYKHKFSVQKKWKGQHVFIVFEGSMTDTEVKINGKLAGPIHQGGFYQFKYDITGLLQYGSKKNILEVKVNKQSANQSVNNAERSGDFWALGGIFRPVYLEAKPATFIDRIAINAKADGSFSLDAFTENTNSSTVVEAQVQDLNEKDFGTVFTSTTNITGKYILTNKYIKPNLWNPEEPNLYKVIVSIKQDGKTLHTITQKFGFRTAELRLQDGFYVNDKKVIFKGVDRHSAWPETGRTLSKELSILDISLMKEMNMNAVRMSHYPPDQHFLDACDSLGLFVLDELTGWQAKYDTIAGRPLVKELVERDVNHPCVVMWANGNEGGWNRALDNDFHLYDPQKRLVYHPWEKFNGTDTKHYPDYNYVVNSSLYGKEVFFPTEFMHGLYDGGHGAGLDDFWNLMIKHPHAAGGFLWSFADEGIVRMDKDSMIDTDGNHAPDGILGPHREKEGSFYTIKEIWSPVHIAQSYIPAGFDGKIAIENRFLYTNLSQCNFVWKLTKLPSINGANTNSVIADSSTVISPSLAPGETGFLTLNLPSNWADNDVLYLTAYSPDHKEIFTWSWPLKTTASLAKTILPTFAASKIETSEDANHLMVNASGIQYYFDKKTGYLSKVINSKSTISLSDGPIIAGVKHRFKEFNTYTKGDDFVVEPIYTGDSWCSIKWTFTQGQSAKLEYGYAVKGEQDVMGISFNYPEEKVTGMKWMGQGPYRVWKNRLKGQQFGIWHKHYNNTITGESWLYPEFKGFHANMYWVIIENKESSFKVITENENIFLQILKPQKPVGAANNNTSPAFAEGNIGFLNAISPIGTKFQSADKLGAQSQKNMQLNYAPIYGTLWFDFSIQ